MRGLVFLSGAAGLIDQVVWSRFLYEVFGVTAHAVAAVLAAFLGGLALGGFFLGRVADRRADPLRFYGGLEIAIGLAAVAGVALLQVLDPIHRAAANRLAPDSAALIAVRLVLASVVVVPATFFMGGTLPALTRVFVDRIGKLGHELSVIYGLNTLGAVAGSLAAGFVLIRFLGLRVTLGIAVALNLAVGILALVLARRGVSSPVAAADAVVEPAQRRAESPAAEPLRAGRGLLLVMALSGFASLALEVLWTRFLVQVIGATTYAFVTMLSSFLVGIALGSFLALRLMRVINDPRRAFGWIQLGIAAATLASVPLLHDLSAAAFGWNAGLESRWLVHFLARFGLSFLIMLVPTTLIGMTLPLAGRIWVKELPHLGRDFGRLYAANTLGNVLGALGSSFWILPVFGVQRGIVVLSVLNLAGAAWAWIPREKQLEAPARGKQRTRSRSRLRTATRAGALLLVIALSGWLLFGFRPRPFLADGEDAGDRVLYYKEDVAATVKVVERAHDARQRWMAVDGTRIGESGTGVDRKQQALAHFPFLIQAPDPEPGEICEWPRMDSPRRVLTIGFGTGILDGEIVRHASVEAVDCVEISGAVIEGAKQFAEHNGNVLANPRVRVIQDDGVNYLRRTNVRYDTIVSDAKSRSGSAGNALLLSADFYALCREHLASGGLMIQWVPLDVPVADFTVLLRTFAAEFRWVNVWYGHHSCFLTGSELPIILDVLHIRRVLASPEAEHLRRYGWTEFYGFIGSWIADQRAFAGGLPTPEPGHGGGLNTLDHPRLEFYSPAAFANPIPMRMAENLALLRSLRSHAPANVHEHAFNLPSPVFGWWPPGSAVDSLRLEASFRATLDLLEGMEREERDPGLDGPGLPILERGMAVAPWHGPLRYAAAESYFKLGNELRAAGAIDQAIARYTRAVALEPEHAEANNNLGAVLAARGDLEGAVVSFRRAVEVNPEFGGAHLNLGKALLAMGDLEGAVDHCREAVRLAPELAQAHLALGAALRLRGDAEAGLAEMRTAARLDPESPAALTAAARILATHPEAQLRDGKEAVRLARRAAKIAEGGGEGMRIATLETLAAAYAEAGDFDQAVATAERARSLAATAGANPMARDMEARLTLYRARQPLREP